MVYLREHTNYILSVILIQSIVHVTTSAIGAEECLKRLCDEDITEDIFDCKCYITVRSMFMHSDSQCTVDYIGKDKLTKVCDLLILPPTEHTMNRQKRRMRPTPWNLTSMKPQGEKYVKRDKEFFDYLNYQYTLDMLLMMNTSASTGRDKRSTPQSTTSSISLKTLYWTLSTPLKSGKTIKEMVEISVAFAYWAGKTNVCFIPVMSGSYDLEIKFTDAFHGGHSYSGSDISHVDNGVKYEIHFDKTANWRSALGIYYPARNGQYLLRSAAAHEAGHLMNIGHLSSGNIMPSDFDMTCNTPYPSTTEIAQAKTIYGDCDGDIFVLHDCWYQLGSNDFYTTFAIDIETTWIYENGEDRAADGWPVKFSSLTTASGLSSPDAIIQVRYQNPYIIDGTTAYHCTFSDSGFPAYFHTCISKTTTSLLGISTIDAAFFEPESTAKVYVFDGPNVRVHSIDLTFQFTNSIETIFQPITLNNSYKNGVDAAYYSTGDEKVYLFRNKHYYEGTYDGVSKTFKMSYAGKWNTKWKYLCETCL